MIRFVALSCAVGALAGCPTTTEDPCGEPAYGGVASDEAYLTIVDAFDKVSADDDQAPQLTTPEDGAVIGKDGNAPTFAWASSLSSSLGPSWPQRSFRRRAPSLLDELSQLVLPVAHAHLPPVTGDIYLSEIAVPGRECPVRGLTTDLEWQLDEASWTALQESSGQELTLRMISAFLVENRLSEGPFEPSSKRSFRVE